MTKKKDDEKKKMVEIELTETLVKYDFSQDELVTIGEQVAGFAEKLATLEAEAKQVAKQYKADIEGVELQQDRLIRFIRDKFEMRRLECFKVIDGQTKKVWFFRADLHNPKDLTTVTPENLRRAISMDDIIPAKERDARPSELQRELPLDTDRSVEIAEDAELAKEMAQKATE